MEVDFNMEGVGTVHVRGNRFTGRFSLAVNGEPMKRVGRREFALGQGSEKLLLFVKGNLFKGYRIPHGKYLYPLYDPAPWYVYALPAISLDLSITIAVLTGFFPVPGFYYLGGALGGGISGLLSGLAASFAAWVPERWMKILICVACFFVTFATCLGLGNLIVWAYSH